MKLVILGRQPKISLAELASLFKDKVQAFGSQAALVDVADIDINRLGGTIKIGDVTQTLDTAHWPTIREQLMQLPSPAGAKKFNFGLSVYGFSIDSREVLATGLALKKTWEGSTRLVPPNKGTVVSTAQALYNRLLPPDGQDLIIATDGRKTLIAPATSTQDIEAYTSRDHARPGRDAKLGMLPPKLAQIMLNLANPAPGSTVLDPFCGTGVVLQEALLAGHPAIGSDIDNEVLKLSKQNLEWLGDQQPLPNYHLQTGDATSSHWPDTIGAVVTEGYLGPPLSVTPRPAELGKLSADASQLTLGFLKNLKPQLPAGTPVVITLPAWRLGSKFRRLEIVDQITQLGYTLTRFELVSQSDLIYWRPGQIVGREITVLRSN